MNNIKSENHNLINSTFDVVLPMLRINYQFPFFQHNYKICLVSKLFKKSLTKKFYIALRAKKDVKPNGSEAML